MDWNIGMTRVAWKHIECGYIVYEYSDDRFSNSGETFAYFCIFVKKMQKLAYIQSNISEHARSISINYSALIDMWVGIINLMFVLISLIKGRCYGIWGTFCKY